ncbi:MAG: FmdB family transcriptional regulator [Spirochaetes bacterium]|nr:FmdB family transcriptional regulator [Spirochaetota bacterium]
MPTYHYRCNTCEHEFDRFQSITSPAVSECPECKAESRRLISGGSGVIYKGSGFYVNDYKGSNSSSNKTETKAAPACGAADGGCASAGCPAAAPAT